MTGWFGADSVGQETAFVIAWLDTGLLEDPDFGPHWDDAVCGQDGSGANKWESGGPTPSLNLRSGWIAKGGRILPVTRLHFRTLTSDGSAFTVQQVELVLTDSEGQEHRITGETQSMIPKMYWGNLITYMHAMKLSMDDQVGGGDLMDTYSTYHIRKYGL